MCVKTVILITCAVASQIVPNYAETNENYLGVEPNSGIMDQNLMDDIELKKIIEDLYGPNPELLPTVPPALPEHSGKNDHYSRIEPNSGIMDQNLLNDIELRKSIEDLFGPEPPPPQPVPLSSPTTHNNLNDDGRCSDFIETQTSHLNRDIFAYFGPEIGNDRKAVVPVSLSLSDSDHDLTTESEDDYRFQRSQIIRNRHKTHVYTEPEKTSKDSHKDPDTTAPPVLVVKPQSGNHYMVTEPNVMSPERQPFRRHELTADSPKPTVGDATNTEIHKNTPPAGPPFVVKYTSRRNVYTVDSIKPTVAITTNTGTITNEKEATGGPEDKRNLMDKPTSGSHSFKFSFKNLLVTCIAILCVLNL